MEKIREILRMKEMGYSGRGIAGALKVSRPVVSEYLEKFAAAGLKYADIKETGDDALLESLEGCRRPSGRIEALTEKFGEYVKELKRTGVTMRLLWEAYIGERPDGYEYSQFCHHFRQWRRQSEVSMHIEHKAGEKTFVDFTGKKLELTDPKTGEVSEVEVFVAILGASQLTYVEAVRSQRKEDWIRANENMFRYFGGVSRAITPDCLKSAVTKAHRYEPDINPDYHDFAVHHGTAIIPARAGRPKDKALVENAVRLVYQRIFAPLRDRAFFTLEELNEAIRDRLEEHNDRPMQKIQISRRRLFEETERDALLPLPRERYEFKSFQKAKVQFNYHVYLKEDTHYYSVPYRYKGREIRVIYTESAVEMFHDNLRIARHNRERRPRGYTTLADHMPSQHRFLAEWNPERIMKQAESHGKYVREAARNILESRRHPEQAFKSCLGVISLSKKYGMLRLNRACQRALSFGNCSYRTVANILEKGLDRLEEEQDVPSVLPGHANVRGSEYYASGVNE